MINGNTQGVRRYILEEMERLYDLSCNRNEFVSDEMIEALGHYTTLLGREVSVLLSRAGTVMDVSIGEQDRVSMPLMRRRRGTEGLSGVRCVHTHPDGSARLSDVDIGTLFSARMDAMAALSVRDGEAKSMGVSMIGESFSRHIEFGPYHVRRIPHDMLMDEIELATRRVAELIRIAQVEQGGERAILVGVGALERDMDELELLAQTAGAEVVERIEQQRVRDKAHYIGKGRLQDLQLMVSALEADTIIVNDELSAIEVRNLEDALGIKVIDRTVLILDIFARNARTSEGKLQVELAQLQYNLPRLLGTGTALSRLGGGIGTRGPGETKLEVDRRRIRRRIFELEQEIEKLSTRRALMRGQREKNEIPEVALVGYTNAGKTSLLNAVAHAEQHAENKLFATLDPVTRKAKLPSGKEVLFTDTVGFIDKLPHALVSAFRSTLEVATHADLLLHVMDASNPELEKQKEVVDTVLKDLGANEQPTLLVQNKMDLLPEDALAKEGVYGVSAKTGVGIDVLLRAIDEALQPKLVQISVRLGYDEGAKLAQIQKYAYEIDIDYEDDHMQVRASMPENHAWNMMS